MSTEITAEPPVAETPPTELSEEELERRLKLQLVDVSHGVAANAIDAADEHINERTRQRGFRGFINKIWHGNLARDFIRASRVREGREDIRQSGNLYALSGGSQAEHNEATRAIVERFTSEYDLVRRESGESNESFEDAENGAALQTQIRTLIRDYAAGNIQMPALVEERTRILSEYGQHVHEGDRNRGLLYADNIIEVAQNARMAAEHDIALDRIDSAIKGNIGEARVGVRTEANLQAVDRIVDKLYQSRIGSVVNETTLVGGVSIAMNLAKVSTRKAVTAAAATLGLGVGAGVIAGAREHFHIGQERKLHMRQMAEGGQMAENSSRREKLEDTRYETASAQELMDNLRSSSEAANLVGETNPARLQDLIFHIGRAQSLVGFSDARSVDLITYSSKTAVEAERLNLDIEIARAKVALQRILDTTPADQLRAAGVTSNDPEALIFGVEETIVAERNQDIDQRDGVFRKLRTRRTIGMAALGAATGITVGLGFQEGKALIDGGLNGIFTNPDSPNRDTLLAGIFGKNDINEGNHHVDRFSEKYLHHGGLNLPEGYKQVGHSIVGPDGDKVVDGLEWGHYGELSKDSIDALHDAGFATEDKAINYTHHKVVDHKVHHNAREFFKHGDHKGFERVHRDLWYDNNTPAGFYSSTY